MNKLAVLTSGGDAPGMNAAVRAAVRAGIYYNYEVYGVKRGFEGLINGDLEKLNASSVADIIHKGGTFLKTARSQAFMTPEGRKKAVDMLTSMDIRAVIVIGGDGSFRGAEALSREGIQTIGIPATIDNDLAYTDFTIGFDTAVNTVLQAVTNIRDTSSSHEKTTIIEVMGRNCGDLALYAGAAGGAESIIVPEKPFTIKEIGEKIRRGRSRGKLHHILMLAEGAGSAVDIQRKLESETGEKSRITVLGFIQRGGDPTASDRLLASRMGLKAVEACKNGTDSSLIGIRNNDLTITKIDEALSYKKRDDGELTRLTEILST
ncbi:6-phosphofructokinase [Alkalicoccus luteus]|uniref:ATP-dependent 6-phosphofructokinase n=1 Tax=Alkalicoccus luteus TaxID=1237094 RepID=A0A969TUQ9_9BACI|nr:6-phosphofructokinase [Alkalicoccus luteus]NJP37327.1 6-phosphofructokinase [Alkalicoccus luteus]